MASLPALADLTSTSTSKKDMPSLPVPRRASRRTSSISAAYFELGFSVAVVVLSLLMWMWHSTPLASVGVGVVGLGIGALDMYKAHKEKDAR